MQITVFKLRDYDQYIQEVAISNLSQNVVFSKCKLVDGSRVDYDSTGHGVSEWAKTHQFELMMYKIDFDSVRGVVLGSSNTLIQTLAVKIEERYEVLSGRQQTVIGEFDSYEEALRGIKEVASKPGSCGYYTVRVCYRHS